MMLPDFVANPLLAQSGIYYAFSHSDLMGQGICVLLMIFSGVTWTVMLEKGISLKKAKKDSVEFIRLFNEKRNPLALKERAAGNPSPAAKVYTAACDRIENLHLEVPGGGRRALNDVELEVVRASMEQAVADQILLLESKMMFLATAVSASPFLGLFGTVWGITLSFTQLAIQGKAEIGTLAPGVSGALLTTVVALLVAIPSLVGYNIITILITRITVHLDNFTEEVVVRLRIEQLDSVN